MPTASRYKVIISFFPRRAGNKAITWRVSRGLIITRERRSPSRVPTHGVAFEFPAAGRNLRHRTDNTSGTRPTSQSRYMYIQTLSRTRARAKTGN